MIFKGRDPKCIQKVSIQKLHLLPTTFCNILTVAMLVFNEKDINLKQKSEAATRCVLKKEAVFKNFTIFTAVLEFLF